MINRLMISVAAAALIAGTGFANAQGTGIAKHRRRAPACSRVHRIGSRFVRRNPMNRDSAAIRA